MSRELSTAGGQLRSAVDQYARSCSNVRDACLGGGHINNTRELLKSLEKEANDIELYTRTLGEARAAIQLARSSVSKVDCGNKLPVEILTRIFDLITPSGSCLVQRDNKRQISGIKYPLHPDSLAHVCSYWRRVTISHPSLWTHIDIALDHYLNPGLFARGKAYATRAGHLPVEIHISDPGSERERNRSLEIINGALTHDNPLYGPSHNWSDLHDFKIFSSDTVVIRSLELDLKIDHRYRQVYYSIVEYFFARSKPGLLTQYMVRCASDNSTTTCSFIEPVDKPQSLNSVPLAVSNNHLEELWARIPILRVSGLCPYWTSKAYDGLVELYVGPMIPGITRSQLVNVLRASPKLQVFHLEAVVEDLEEHGNTNHVSLDDLRDLKLMTRGDKNLSGLIILLWINPGKEPLQMSYARVPLGEVWEFFQRAKVVRFYLTCWSPYGIGPLLLRSSGLETLVLNAYNSDVQDHSCLLLPGVFSDDIVHEAQRTTRINTLYLIWFAQFNFEEIQAVVEKYSVQKLLIYGGQLAYQTGEGTVICKNTRDIKVKLSSITTCPVMEYYPDANLIYQDCDEWIGSALVY